MRIKLLLLFIALQFQSIAQTTYVWVGANNAEFGTPSNWSPSRDTARGTDILHFRNNVGGDTLLITNYGWGINSQSNAAQMWVESGKSIVFVGQTFPNQMYGALLTLYGGDGPVLQVDSNAHFGLYTPEISFFTFNPRTIDINPIYQSEVIIDGRVSIQSTSNISPGNFYFKNSLITLNGNLDLLSSTQFTNGNFQGVFIANQPGYVYFGNPNYNSKMKVYGNLNFIGGGDQFVNACDSCIEYLNGSKLILNYNGNLSRNNLTGHYFQGSEIQVLSLPANQTHVLQLPDSVYDVYVDYINSNAALQFTSASTQYNYQRRDVLVKGNFRLKNSGNAFVQFNQEDNFDAYIQGNLFVDGGRLKIVNQGINYANTKSRLFLTGNYYQSAGELIFGGQAQRFGVFAINGNFFSNGGYIKNPGGSINSRIEFNGNNTQTIHFFNQVDDSMQFLFDNPSGFVLVSNLNIGDNSMIEISRGSFSGNGRIDYNGLSTLCFKNNNGIYQTNNKIWSTFSSPSRFILAGTGGVFLHSTKTITHFCDLQKGKLYLNPSDTFYLGNQVFGTGNIQYNSNSYIVGRLSRWVVPGLGNYVFPVGTNSADRRLSIDYVSLNGNSAYVTAEFVNAQPGVLGLPLNQTGININKTGTEGYWRIRPANGFISGIYNLHVLAKQFGGVQNVSNLVLIRREIVGSPFQLLGGHVIGSGSIDSVVLARTNLNAYGDFAVGGDLSQNPLPVELLSFEGFYSPQDQAANLNWKSAREINVFKYEIERSFDAKYWNKQGEVMASGNTEMGAAYEFSDDFETPSGYAYYRLKMIDLDGTFEYSKMIILKNENQFEFKMFPNPSSGNDIELSETTAIEVMDISGRKVYEGITNRIDVSGFPKGIYLVKSPFGTERLCIK